MIQIVDAQQMAKTYPDSFKAPDQKDLDSIKVGSSVKICLNNKERLWVEVTEINGAFLKGKIDNCPIVIEDVSFGDFISFRKENIYCIF